MIKLYGVTALNSIKESVVVLLFSRSVSVASMKPSFEYVVLIIGG